jgi:hypothetical protein
MSSISEFVLHNLFMLFGLCYGTCTYYRMNQYNMVAHDISPVVADWGQTPNPKNASKFINFLMIHQHKLEWVTSKNP